MIHDKWYIQEIYFNEFEQFIRTNLTFRCSDYIAWKYVKGNYRKNLRWQKNHLKFFRLCPLQFASPHFFSIVSLFTFRITIPCDLYVIWRDLWTWNEDKMFPSIYCLLSCLVTNSKVYSLSEEKCSRVRNSFFTKFACFLSKRKRV